MAPLVKDTAAPAQQARNLDKRPKMYKQLAGNAPFCRWRYKKPVVCYAINCHSPKMAVGDQTTCCTHHQTSKIALFCQTCEELICTKCISKGPNSSARHHEHVYLDLSEAYDIQREEYEKVVARFCEQLQSKKNERKELQTIVQKLKFELLRRKTIVEKKVKSLKDSVRKNEAAYLKKLTKVLEPAIERSEQRFNDAEYDVVSREGLIGASESAQALPPHKAITFLRMVVPLKRDMKTITNKEEKSTADDLAEMKDLSKIYLSLSRAKACISQAFAVAEDEPSSPKLLPRWCTIGTNSAHITWKFSQGDVPERFHVFYRRMRVTTRQKPYHGPENMSFSSIHQKLGYKLIKIRRFGQKRVSALLPGLDAGKTYEVKVTTVNACGESAPTSWFFVTCEKKSAMGVIQKRDPRKCNICATTFKLLTWLTIVFIIICYGILSIYLIYDNHETLLVRLCDYTRDSYANLPSNWLEEADFMDYLHVVCPKKVEVTVEQDFPIVNDSSEGVSGGIFDWLAKQY